MSMHAQKRKGFTLVEMLVVMSIIMILIALLLPTFYSVRHQANVNLCANNLRLLGTAVVQYSQENAGYIPPVAVDYSGWGDWWHGNQGTLLWYDLISKYAAGDAVGSSNVGTSLLLGWNEARQPIPITVKLMCPEFKNSHQNNARFALSGYSMNYMPFLPNTADHRAASPPPPAWNSPAYYSANCNFAPDVQGPVLSPGGGGNIHWPAMYGYFVRLDQIQDYPSTRLLIGETTGYAGLPGGTPYAEQGGGSPGANYRYIPVNNYTSGSVDAYTPGGNSLNKMPYTRSISDDADGTIGGFGSPDFYRHSTQTVAIPVESAQEDCIPSAAQQASNISVNDNSRPCSNVLFVDGHVDYVTPWDLWWSINDPSKVGQKWWHNP